VPVGGDDTDPLPWLDGGVVSRPPPPSAAPTGKRKATRLELDVVAGLLIQVALPEEVEAIENAIARARPLTES
jgi:hypothetical protein